MINSSSALIIAAAITTFSNMTFAIVCLSLGVVGSIFGFFTKYNEKIDINDSDNRSRESARQVLRTFAETDIKH